MFASPGRRTITGVPDQTPAKTLAIRRSKALELRKRDEADEELEFVTHNNSERTPRKRLCMENCSDLLLAPRKSQAVVSRYVGESPAFRKLTFDD